MNTVKQTELYTDRLNELRKKIHKYQAQPIEVEYICKWLERKRKENTGKVQFVPIPALKDWMYSEKEGIVRHKKGTSHFFTVRGIITNNIVDTEVSTWNQPILDQKEGGYLVILCQERDNNIKFLLHAKFEPGNIGYVQLGPTIQATSSNLKQHHEGRKPRFSEYINHAKTTIIYSAKHNEEGSRFWRKSNVNRLVLLPRNENLKEDDNYIWLSLDQIKALMLYNNVVNPFVKTILSPL